MERNDIEKLLKKFNLKVTLNRVLILQQFLDDHQFHTITEITSHLKDTNTKSIYNNIQKMVELGLLESFSVGGEVYYEIVDFHKLSKNQAHVISKNKIEHLDLDQSIFNEIEKNAKKKNIDPKRIKIIIEE